jgi:hypothetical protein
LKLVLEPTILPLVISCPPNISLRAAAVHAHSPHCTPVSSVGMLLLLRVFSRLCPSPLCARYYCARPLASPRVQLLTTSRSRPSPLCACPASLSSRRAYSHSHPPHLCVPRRAVSRLLRALLATRCYCTRPVARACLTTRV